MSGERSSASQGGFTGAPRVGFAQHLAEKPRGYGSYAPPAGGFAAAYRQGIEEVEAGQARRAERAARAKRRKVKKADRPVEGAAYPTSTDTAEPKKSRTKPARRSVNLDRHVKLNIDIGRPLRYDSKGFDWDILGAKIMEANPQYADSMTVISPSRLILRYLSYEQAQRLFAARLESERPRSTSNERKRIFELCETLNGCIADAADREIIKTEQQSGQTAKQIRQTIARQRDPDNPEWANEMPRYGTSASFWLPAKFEVKSSLGSSAPGKLSIDLADEGQVLADGHRHFLDMLDNNGFDASGLGEGWSKQIDIVELKDGLTVDHIKGLAVPGFDQLVPLDIASVAIDRRQACYNSANF